MATFPSEEIKIIKLGLDMSSGLKANASLYPAPPVDPVTLDEALATCATLRETAVAAQSAAEQATAAKQAGVQALADKIRLNLRYAEMMVEFDDAKLKAIGWAGRKERTQRTAPGQPLALMAAEQGEGWIKLKWKKPTTGGKVAAYKILCRERTGSSGEWKSQDTAVPTEFTLTGQPRGKELEYAVMAVNGVGAGPMSNMVMAVL